VLDDWATPLYAYVLAGAYRLTGIEPGDSLEATVGVAKGVSFLASLLALPALYAFGRRWYGREVGLGAMAILAVLPVHAIYAGFALRESLVALTSIIAVGTLVEVWRASSGPRPGRAWAWAIVAGLSAGLAILARNTAIALMGAAGLFGLIIYGRRIAGPLLLWGGLTLLVILPWAWATYTEYGQPFYSYTNHFEYNFSWTVHHYEQGNTRPDQFYTRANAPEILRVKVKSLLIIVVTSTMIFSLPLVLGVVRRLVRGEPDESEVSPDERRIDLLIVVLALTFVVATLARIADITQVTQLGRYYLPIFALAVPTAVAGIRDWIRAWSIPVRALPALAAMLVALLWSDPTWAYDASWFVKPYQLHWPALRKAGDWIRQHRDQVPPDARIMTWFPWELRVASDRTTVLFPRNFSQRRIQAVIKQYGVTHLLWGSFEFPPHTDPETDGPGLERLRLSLGLTDAREIYRSPESLYPTPESRYPVRLYRLQP
jgi:4-amino-4-deoxy-L-arabinose transferase-like glycosyltransferase